MPCHVAVVVEVSLNRLDSPQNAKQGWHGVIDNKVNLDGLDVSLTLMPSSDLSSRDVSAMVEAFGVLFYNPESVELHIVATSYQQWTCDEYLTIEPSLALVNFFRYSWSKLEGRPPTGWIQNRRVAVDLILLPESESPNTDVRSSETL